MDAVLHSGSQNLAEFREKRHLHILAIAIVAGLSGVLLYSGIDASIGILPFALVAGLAYFCVVGVTATILIAMKPAFGALMELMAASRLIVALAAAQSPTLAYKVISSPLLSAALVVGGAMGLRLALALISRRRTLASR
jgi:hypothetical protein